MGREKNQYWFTKVTTSLVTFDPKIKLELYVFVVTISIVFFLCTVQVLF